MNSSVAPWGRPLIISYSYSGNTHRIAQCLQELTGGEWREIYPWQPYPMAFPELLEQVRKEIRSGRPIRLLPGPGLSGSCRVIFAGSPNWCGTLAPPLASWLRGHDLAGKIILPFCSHCGGVSCDMARDISALCPGAVVLEPLEVLGDGGRELPDLLRAWLIRTDAIKFRPVRAL